MIPSLFKLTWWRVMVLVVLASLIAISGCDREPSADPMGTGAGDADRMRVVSLAPALTQMIVDMGMGDTLVGVAQYDTVVPKSLPVMGHYLDINLEALLGAKPTHVVMMTGRDAAPQHLVGLARTGRFKLYAYPSPLTIPSITKTLYDDSMVDPVCLGTALGNPEVARNVAEEMTRRLAHLENLTAGLAKPKVLMIIGVHPFMASGPGTVFDQLLAICGGRNAAEGATVGAPVFDKEKLVHADPDVILMLLPNAPALGAVDSDPRLAQLRGLDISATRSGRIVLINDPLVHLPSSSLPRIGAAMIKAIHPGLAGRVEDTP